jgi:hypothetical protein
MTFSTLTAICQAFFFLLLFFLLLFFFSPLAGLRQAARAQAPLPRPPKGAIYAQALSASAGPAASQRVLARLVRVDYHPNKVQNGAREGVWTTPRSRPKGG